MSYQQPTPDEIEQASLNVVALLSAIHQGLPARDVWESLDVTEQHATAMTMAGCLIASCNDQARRYGITTEMVLEDLAGAGLAEAERRRRLP